MILKVHALLPHTEANGPGIRAGIWVQGCRHRCFGCCNPETHDPKGGVKWSTTALARWLRQLPDTEGITVSGGEPLDQPEAVRHLLENRPPHLSAILYTGYTLAQLKQRSEKTRYRVLELVDVLIHGPYMADRHVGRYMIGSSNQQVELLSGRYTMHQIRQVPEYEIIVLPDGGKVQTGVGAAPKPAH